MNLLNRLGSRETQPRNIGGLLFLRSHLPVGFERIRFLLLFLFIRLRLHPSNLLLGLGRSSLAQPGFFFLGEVSNLSLKIINLRVQLPILCFCKVSIPLFLIKLAANPLVFVIKSLALSLELLHLVAKTEITPVVVIDVLIQSLNLIDTLHNRLLYHLDASLQGSIFSHEAFHFEVFLPLKDRLCQQLLLLLLAHVLALNSFFLNLLQLDLQLRF